MKQLSKQEYQKRGILIQKLAFLLELTQKENAAFTLTCLLSPIGEVKHPSKWTDNEFLGAVEKEIFKIDNGIDEE